ncbi:MAG: proline--tRNA ligase, partial [Gammaproteobacteria bacterium]|nr:proline--tRNA ligase [Gammaproteobacteria bacterium]
EGKNQIMTMGCYGIGISRVVASAIEQNHDESGIIWPESIAPFDIAIAPINLQKSEALQAACDKLYEELTAAGYDVLYYDAKGRLGGMLADLELIGIPHRLVIGDRGLESGMIEYKGRRDEEKQEIALDSVLEFIKQQSKK